MTVSLLAVASGVALLALGALAAHLLSRLAQSRRDVLAVLMLAETGELVRDDRDDPPLPIGWAMRFGESSELRPLVPAQADVAEKLLTTRYLVSAPDYGVAYDHRDVGLTPLGVAILRAARPSTPQTRAQHRERTVAGVR